MTGFSDYASENQIVAVVFDKTGANVLSGRQTTVGGYANPAQYWATVNGGSISAVFEKVYDGNHPNAQPLCGPQEIADISVTKPYDPYKDTEVLADLRKAVGQKFFDIYVYTLNCDLLEPGSERKYPDALLVGLEEPNGDASSGSPVGWGMQFSVHSVESETTLPGQGGQTFTP